MAPQYNTIPQSVDEDAAAPLIADAPKANYKSAALIAAVCLASAIAGTAAPSAAHALSNSLFYTKGQLYLGDSSIDGEVCLAIDGKTPRNRAKLEVWNCKDSPDLAKIWTQKGSGEEFQIEYGNSGYCVAGATRSKGFREGSNFYLWECRSNDDTQLFARDNGRHLKYVHSEHDGDYKLCMAADGTSDGKAVRAKECIDNNKYQKWKFYN